jgi:uncharacterized repeat protein (TIGR03803 family)
MMTNLGQVQGSISRFVKSSALGIVLASVALAPQSTQAQTYNELHRFTGGADGATPHAGLVLDDSGNFYGTTTTGGASNLGTVFKLDTTGTETVLHSFAGAPDGATPHAGLVLDTLGNLYGTTEFGGASNLGTVFKLDTTGTETVLYSFKGGAAGRNPSSGLVLDAAGNFYGTTGGGGVNRAPCAADGFLGCGVVFKVDTTGTQTVLYTFTGGADGRNPEGGLVLDASGNLYGTGIGGGTSDLGVVFKLDPSGKETVLYNFTGSNDGCFPQGTLVFDHADNLYGLTVGGGAANFGTVFELDTTGKETLLYSFTGGTDVVTPNAGLLLDTEGNLYGTTAGNASDFGTVFDLSPDFSLTTSGLAPNRVSPGVSSTSTVNVKALGAFIGSVALSCAVLPSSASTPTCAISPSSITVGTPATLTVSATGGSAGTLPSKSGSEFYALWLPLIGVFVSGLASGKKSKGRIRVVAPAVLLFAVLAFGIACGGTGGSRGSGGTPAKFYTITVTGSSVSLKHSTTLTLTVQ